MRIIVNLKITPSATIKILILIFISTFCNSCKKEYTGTLEESLQLAGANRSELQKVLEHYSENSEDSLKYKAACFLIENMKWHHGKSAVTNSKFWDLFFFEDSLSKDSSYLLEKQQIEQKRIRLKQIILDTKIKQPFLPDINSITKEILINNIDAAFEVKNLDWCKKLSFPDFCEYILPYRFNNEPITVFRKDVANHFKNLYETDSLKRDPYKVIPFLRKYILRMGSGWDKNDALPDLGFFNILHCESKLMACDQQTALLGQIARSIGIPIIEITTPCWTDSKIGHKMCYIPYLGKNTNIFHALYQNPDGSTNFHNQFHAPKLYQLTFSDQQKSPYYLRGDNEEIPRKFASPCLIDVTNRYLDTKNIEIEIRNIPAGINLCWFSLFINGKWWPVGWGTIDRNQSKAKFDDIPIGLTGVACHFQNNQMLPISNIITITDTGFTEIIPDKKSQEMRLTSKFPIKISHIGYNSYNDDGTIEGSNDKDFIKINVLATIPDSLKPYHQDIELKNKENYRYYRIKSAKRKLQLSEVEFLTSKQLPGTIKATPLPILQPSNNIDKQYYKFMGTELAYLPCKAAFDGDMLTYTSQKWIGMDMQRTVKVEKIRIVPRNSNNGIVKGDRYQLFYWDDKWKPAGIKKAEYNFIQFSNVLSNTLYWLRNLDNGEEELPFFYIDGKQVFTSDIRQ